jgi:hypothetical protein
VGNPREMTLTKPTPYRSSNSYRLDGCGFPTYVDVGPGCGPSAERWSNSAGAKQLFGGAGGLEPAKNGHKRLIQHLSRTRPSAFGTAYRQ